MLVLVNASATFEGKTKGHLGELLCRTATEGEMTSTLKHVKPGDAIMSLLSFLDHLARYIQCTWYTCESEIIELQQEQALQDCECQGNGGYQGHQTAFWRLQGLSQFNIF